MQKAFRHSGVSSIVLSEILRKRAKPQSVAQQVVDSLREMILTGELEEGAPLRQDVLAGILQVSRIPVREALRQLEAEGLVTFFAHRGAIVSALSLGEIRELFDARALLESDLLARAIPHLTEADFTRAGEVLDVYEDALARADVRICGHLNWRFHSALYAAASRPMTLGLVQTLNFNADRYLRLHLQLANAMDLARRDHRRLLELCRAKRGAAACEFLREHILGAGDALIDLLARRRSEQSTGRPVPARHSRGP